MKISTNRIKSLLFFGLFHIVASVIWMGQARAFPRASMPQLPSLATPILYNSLTIETLVNQRPNDFLVSVILRNESGEEHFCIGTLLAPDLVITAAHCFLGIRSAAIEYMVSSNPIKFAKIQAKSWKVHENYVPGLPISEKARPDFADFALLALQKPVPGRRAIKVVPRSFEWNQISPNPDIGHADWLRVLGVYRDEKLIAQKRYAFAGLKSVESLSWSIYTAELEPNRGWCVRDSGGPVALLISMDNGSPEYALMGIAYSFYAPTEIDFSGDKSIQSAWKGDKVPRCGEKIFFTPILPYLPWIEEAAKELFDDAGKKTRIRVLGES